MAAAPELVLVYEPEQNCRARLIAQGFGPGRAGEIASYLAQSTDLAAEFEEIELACRTRGLGFLPLDLDRIADLARRETDRTLVWTLTDGIAYFRGSVAPALARLYGLAAIGSEEAAFALCQDKFRSNSIMSALGLPVPPAGLARDGVWLVEPPRSATGYFVKPNRLGAKIGIWEESRCTTADEALALSRRIFAAYRDDALVQVYVPGRNVRGSFLAVDPAAGLEALGLYYVDSGSDFQTMADSQALYGATGAAAKAAGTYHEPRLSPIAETCPRAAKGMRAIAGRLMECLGIRDVFSLDLRLEDNGAIHLIEFEVCPGLPCFDFRAYCRSQWGLRLADAMAEAAARRLSRR